MHKLKNNPISDDDLVNKKYVDALKSTQNLEYEGTVVTCENTLASRTSDMLIKGNTYQNLGAGVIKSAGENENKIIITSNNNKLVNDIDYKECKKEISLPIEGGLKLLPNGVYDTIEQRNDGVYLVQKIGKYDIKENDEIKIDSPPNQQNTIAFAVNVKAKNIKTSGNNICNNFNRFASGDLYWNSDKEGILNSSNSQFKFRILKSKLSTQDIVGIKAWIKANPTTVCYEINTPIETKLDINDLDLEVYKDTTYVTTDNAIKPALSFKIPSNIGGVMQTNSQNINKLYKLVNDTQVNADIADLDTNKQDKTDNALDTTDKTVVGAINEINDSLLDNITFSADYKNIIINRKSGLNPYIIPIASIINNAKIIELNDIDATNIGDGKTLVYDGTTQKHKYVDSTCTDELVKMDSTTDAKHLSDLIDKQTIVNNNGVLKVKQLDGQNVTIAEINYLKGLTMNVMDLVNAFANGGVKVLNTPVNTHADLSTLDRSTFLDGISYIVYVLADETHSGAKTTYLCNKTSETFFGNADSQRNFITNPIDLANEVTDKLGVSNIDVDSLWNLLTINDTYKTLTTKNEVFGTHGAKALYDELVADIGNKANSTDLISHTSDTNIHITTAERTKWNEVDNKIDKTDITTTIDSTSTNTQVPSAKVVYDTFNQKCDKINLYEAKDSKNNNKTRHMIIDIPRSHSISGKTTRLFFSDNILSIGLQIWDGSVLERDYRAPLIHTRNIYIASKTLTPVNSKVNLTNIDSSCDYMVINGICYVNIWSMNITGDLSAETIFSGLPTAKASAQFIFSNDVGSKTVGMGWIKMGTQIIQCNAKLETGSTKSQGYASFSYPVAEQ